MANQERFVEHPDYIKDKLTGKTMYLRASYVVLLNQLNDKMFELEQQVEKYKHPKGDDY